MDNRKITSVEKSVQRTLFYRRLCGGIVALFLLLLFVAAYFFWGKQRYQTEHIDVANYDHLDESSPTYWPDRVESDIEFIRGLELPAQQKDSRLRSRLRQTLAAATATPPEFGRGAAVSETALAILRHDVNADIEEFLEFIGEAPLAMALRAKILVTNALMLLRLNDPVAAAVAMNSYERIVNSADIKLDSEASELAFRGAVRVYRYTFETRALDALFQRNLRFASRITDPGLQMRAYRIIATEQAVADRDRDAMETASQIGNPIELARAFQGVIINVARPGKPDLTEPTPFLPKVDGPWDPLPQPRNARRVINDVLQQIASREVVADQVDLLMKLAGSRMVCDPDLYTLFESCLRDFGDIGENVKQPALQLLRNPESATISKSRNMPPSTKAKSLDSALDDWTKTIDDVGVGVQTETVDPTISKDIVPLERLRLQLWIARSYLSVNRRPDAIRSLQQALTVVQSLTNAEDRIDFLLDIVGLQTITGDFTGSRNTFDVIGLPRRVGGDWEWDRLASSSDTEFGNDFVEANLARLTRLKVLARFLEDAELTVNLLPSGEGKDEECAFLATELIRTQRLREAARVTIGMTPGPRQAELRHRIEIAKGGTEENYRSLNIAFPEKTSQDNVLTQSAVVLIQLGLHDAAREAVKRISHPESRSARSLRIVRDLLFSYGAYGSTADEHRTVRKTLLDIALRAANDIEPAQERAAALEMILSAVIPLAADKEELESLQPIVLQALEIARSVPSTVSAKAGTIARLLSAKILLHALTNDRPSSWPLLHREHDKALIDEMMEPLAEAVEILNDIENENAHARGMLALARVFGQIGRTNQVRQLLGSVIETATSQTDKRIGVSLFLGTIPLFRSLGDTEAAKSVYYDAFGVVGNIPDADPTNGNAGMIFGQRLRDGEIDLLARSLFENDFIPEAILFTERISETNLRDRLLRIAVFYFIDKEIFLEAENTAHKHSDPDARALLLRYITFAKRYRGN